MRRITSACLLQTMRFDTANDANPKMDYEIYRKKLDKKNIRYAIDEEKTEPDGSIVIKVRKQYNTYGTEGYIDYE